MNIMNDDFPFYHLGHHVGCDFCTSILQIFPFYCYDHTVFICVKNFKEVEISPSQSILYWFPHDSTPMEVSKEAVKHCKSCDKIFPSASKKYRHVVEVHGGKSEFCDICGKKFAREEYLIKHKLKVHGNHYSICEECEVEFDGEKLLMERKQYSLTFGM